MKEVQVKVPGKLYIAGEYAVVERRQSAILLTVDSFLTVKIKDTSNDFYIFYLVLVYSFCFVWNDFYNL